MPADESVSRVDAYWTRRMFCDERELASGSSSVRSYPADPSHRSNVIAVRRLGGGCVINVHDRLLPAIARLEGLDADRAFDVDVLRAAYGGHRVERMIPAAQGYADVTDLRDPPPRAVDVSEVGCKDDASLLALCDACTAADWLEASMDEATPPLFATFVDGEIAAIAHAIERGGLRHIGVLTHPLERGRGYSRAAAYMAARHFAGEGAVIEWQARLSNAPSLAVRDALGFVERYRTIVLKVG